MQSVRESVCHSLALTLIGQSISPSVRACTMSHDQAIQLTFRPAPSITISGYVCPWVLLSISQPSAHPSVRQPSFHRPTNQSILPSSPRFPIDPSVTHSIDPCITQATVKSKTNSNLHLAQKCIKANIRFFDLSILSVKVLLFCCDLYAPCSSGMHYLKLSI